MGAGLPIISTLKQLLDTGDEIQRIEGVFRCEAHANRTGIEAASVLGCMGACVLHAEALALLERSSKRNRLVLVQPKEIILVI